MIDSDTREQQRERKRQYARARYEANRDEILARKRRREKALFTAVKVYKRPARWCLECGETIPEDHHPHDFCKARHEEIYLQRKYHARALPFLPTCERQRR